MANTYKMMNLEKDTSGGDIVSVQWDGGKLQNGTPVILGDLVTGEREIYYAKCTGATGIIGTSQVYVVYSPEVMYAAGTMIDDFYVATGMPARAYGLKEGSIFVITSGAYIGTAAVGDWFVMQATGASSIDPGLSQFATTSTIGTNKFIAQVIELTTLGYDNNTAAVAQVIRA